jgi:hypothetical protein
MAGFVKHIKHLMSEKRAGFLDEMSECDPIKTMCGKYEGYTNTVTALRFLLTNLFDGQLRGFPSSDVGFKNAYSSSLNWLYW